ncbi:hypothetical protein [Gryllotalpicola protaetiae]|uniref:HAD family hydrolase n=1 Tax=Gryllotalpicola protaetiae TaxID=2419771 RepID=A0A387BH58_9MICO|nr:hypothetical protein [Gryllotalpicola protaetiae]AYG03243.1 hypothetical protein D7I44_06680 [Gryllotalpicola protaetiae]
MPDLGLLLDVDGPIASPVTRSIAIPSIADDLVTLVGAGVPVAFITGRSSEFIEQQVVQKLLAHGLADALQRPGARMFGVFEKGGAWAAITPGGMAPVTVDESVAPSDSLISDIRMLVRDRFADTMFFDETKRAMISVEQNHEVEASVYLKAQSHFDRAAFDVLVDHGIGVYHRERVAPDVNGSVTFRLDSTIISTDIESVLLDKDRGAQRALEYFAAAGELPHRWRSVGDSRSDYKMADFLHGSGYETAHVDVRPSDGVLEKPYPVITEGAAVHDEAGAIFLRYWVEKLGLA